MLKEGVNGFSMALADSVPGVSGGTVAFIMGFYDQFIGSIHDMVFGDWNKKKEAVRYLVKLGIGWVIGMALAVMILTRLFESHIYVVSSVFIGFIAGAIPLIVREEWECVRQVQKGLLSGIIGMVLVVGISFLNGRMGSTGMNLQHFSIGLGVQLFLIGMIAISAMFLPGISGSTLLLIFGAYIPVITAIKGVLTLQFNYIPALFCFGCGILAGAASVVKGIQICLEKFRPQAIYAILGMMIGSFYPIVLGPTTLDVPSPAMTFGTFHIVAALLGVVLVIGMQVVRERGEQHGVANS